MKRKIYFYPDKSKIFRYLNQINYRNYRLKWSIQIENQLKNT